MSRFKRFQGCSFYLKVMFSGLLSLSRSNNSIELVCRFYRREVRAHHGMEGLHLMFCFFWLVSKSLLKLLVWLLLRQWLPFQP
ncbi:hypothetical protein GLYMA_03G014050v4 [Glycine max]|nr:hypothetical protein GLYMA_03G014050v4 [Glycine max]KAH1068165.1 hypothetical protein GYH30_005930 [Glycine max]